MNKNKTTGKANQRFTLLLMVAALFWAACSDDENIVGKDILPPSDEVDLYYASDFAMNTQTEKIDSMISDEAAYSTSRPYALLGANNDPVFGTSKASFITEARLSSNLVGFGNNFVPDSIVLYLALKSIYGESRQFSPLNIHVYLLTDSLSLDSSYASNLDIEGMYDESNPIAEFAYLPIYNDSILSIPLQLDPFLDIFNDTTNLVDNESFKAVFKGLYLTTDPMLAGGSIMGFDMLSDNSKITLHYHNHPESPIVPYSAHSEFDLLINEKCSRINLFEHDHNAAQYPIPYIGESNDNDTLTYIQGMAGLRSKLNIEGLFDWATTIREEGSPTLVISRASLFIPTLEGSTDNFKPPTNLNLFNIDDDGELDFIVDLVSNGTAYSEYFDGAFNADTMAYEFNITQYVQQIIDGNINNNGLYIAPYSPDNVTTANRVILKNANANSGMRLYVSYLKL